MNTQTTDMVQIYSGSYLHPIGTPLVILAKYENDSAHRTIEAYGFVMIGGSAKRIIAKEFCANYIPPDVIGDRSLLSMTKETIQGDLDIYVYDRIKDIGAGMMPPFARFELKEIDPEALRFLLIRYRMAEEVSFIRNYTECDLLKEHLPKFPRLPGTAYSIDQQEIQ